MRADRRGHGLEVGQVVAGVEDQVRVEAGQAADPVDLAGLARQQVQVGQVQHPHRGRAGGSTGTLNRRSVKALRSTSEA